MNGGGQKVLQFGGRRGCHWTRVTDGPHESSATDPHRLSMPPSPRVGAVVVAAVIGLLAVGGTATAAEPVRETTSFARSGGEVQATVTYDVPRNVDELTVAVPVLATDGASLVDTANVRRTDDTTFEWTGRGRPQVVVGLPSGTERVVAGDGWALATRPGVRISYGYTGGDPGYSRSVTVDGAGYAADPFVYLGPYRRQSVTVDGDRTTFVVAEAAGEADLAPATAYLRTASGRFEFGVDRSMTVFVLPEGAPGSETNRHRGVTGEGNFWVRRSEMSLQSTGTAFTHEYVHVHLGIVGEGSARWITEGAAEYFGHVHALNHGAGDYESFREALRAPRYAPNRTAVTLAEPASWRGTTANYHKGGHVLAALDAEIRDRTDGRYTLADVFEERPGPYADHAAFKAAVVQVTGVSALGEWLDEYARTDALPPLPAEPGSYIYGPDLDPDADGVASGDERVRRRHPFVADGPTPTETPMSSTMRSPTTGRSPDTTQPTAPTTERTNEPTSGRASGFGPIVALVALVALCAAATRRR